MDNKVVRIILICLAPVIFAVAAYFIMNSGGKHYEAIPDNAAVLAKIDFGNLLDKSKVLENSTIKAALEELADEMPSKKIKNLFLDIVEKPEESGIDISQPVVAALLSLDEADGVIAIAMADKEKFISFIDCVSKGKLDIEDEDDYSYIDIDEDGIAVAFDNDKLLFVFNEDKADADFYMNLEPEKRAMANTRYKEFFADDDAALFVDFKPIVAQVAELPEFENEESLLQVLKMMKNITFFSTLNFENGYAELAYRFDVPEMYRKVIDKVFITPDKRHYKYIPDECAVFASAALDYKVLYNLFPEENREEFSSLLSMIGLAETVIDDFEGEMTFAMLEPKPFRDTKSFQIMYVIDCGSRDMFDFMISSVGDELTMVAEDVYALKANEFYRFDDATGRSVKMRGGYDYYFMYKDNAMFFLPENVYAQIEDGDGVKPLRDDIGGNSFVSNLSRGCVVDFSNLAKGLEEMGTEDNDFQFLAQVATFMNSAVFDVKDPLSVSFRINFTNTSENSLQFIVNEVVEVLHKL